MSNGYTSITINEQAIGLRFGMPALKRIAEKVQVKEGEDYSEVECAHFMYAGYLNNCIVKDCAPTLEYEDFYNFAEKCLYEDKDAQVIVDVIKCFSDSRIVQMTKEADQKKSQTTPKKSQTSKPTGKK